MKNIFIKNHEKPFKFVAHFHVCLHKILANHAHFVLVFSICFKNKNDYLTQELAECVCVNGITVCTILSGREAKKSCVKQNSTIVVQLCGFLFFCFVSLLQVKNAFDPSMLFGPFIVLSSVEFMFRVHHHPNHWARLSERTCPCICVRIVIWCVIKMKNQYMEL